MVFQSAMNALNPVMTIGDQIIDTIQAHERRSTRKRATAPRELLDIVGIDDPRSTRTRTSSRAVCGSAP